MEKIYKLYSIMCAPAVKKMNGNRGRMATQAAHGFMHAYWDSCDRFPEDAKAYRAQPSAFKIALVADTEDQLYDLIEKYKSICGFSLVLERGTKSDGTVDGTIQGVTCLGLGPIDISLIEDDLRALKGFL